MKCNKGFTLAEVIIILVVVLILIGIALPKYYEIRNQDRLTVARNFANSLATASALNFEECKHGASSNCKKVAACEDLSGLLSNPLPKKMSITLKSGTPFPTTSGSIVECQVNFYSQSVSFKAIANP